MQSAREECFGQGNNTRKGPEAHDRGLSGELPGLQALYLPSPKTEEKARDQRQRRQQFNGWGSLHVLSKVLE